jgi:Ser/Thr protein kinase RdoA (MazF antagonist)
MVCIPKDKTFKETLREFLAVAERVSKETSAELVALRRLSREEASKFEDWEKEFHHAVLKEVESEATEDEQIVAAGEAIGKLAKGLAPGSCKMLILGKVELEVRLAMAEYRSQ